jgi:Cu/Ag efflux protein CusF
LKIDVTSEGGIVTLSGTVDSVDKRRRADEIVSGINGVKGVVDNIQVAGAAAPAQPTSAAAIDATGTVASVDASSGTITLNDGRVLSVGDRTSVYQPTSVKALKAGDQVLLRGATPSQQLVLTDGTVVRVPTSANVHRRTERLGLSQIEPGAEVVIQRAPVPAASPVMTPPLPTPTQTAPVPTTSTPTSSTQTPTSRAASAGVAVYDATDVSVVSTPSAAAGR